LAGLFSCIASLILYLYSKCFVNDDQ